MKDRLYYFPSLIFFCLFGLPTALTAQISAPTENPPEIIQPNVAPTPEKTAPEIPVAESDLIHNGDLLDVDVVGSTEYDWRGTLNPEGFINGITFLENPIFGLCRREEAVAADLGIAYAKFLRAPQVVVKILDRSNRPAATIYGAVKTPQRFKILRPVRLNELLVIAGGLTDQASGDVQIYRPRQLNCDALNSAASSTDAEYVNLKISDLLTGIKDANPLILSGDTILVREAEAIYLIGGVANPKPIYARSQMTLARAVASAGGVAKNGDASKVTIYRRVEGVSKIIEADLDKIQSGQTADIALQSFDIVEVAQTKAAPRKFPPVLKIIETDKKNNANLPLRIIN